MSEASRVEFLGRSRLRGFQERREQIMEAWQKRATQTDRRVAMPEKQQHEQEQEQEKEQKYALAT